MKELKRRLGTLERKSGIESGWNIYAPCHTIIKDEGQGYASALSAYRVQYPDKPVEAGHNVMWIEIISPKFDADGRLIPQEKTDHQSGPSLADVLSPTWTEPDPEATSSEGSAHARLD